MHPTHDQIEVAAYHRWERRARSHGNHRDDWAAAEKDLVFALNYRYIARHKLNGDPVFLGRTEAAGHPRRCRFCDLSEPSASFEARVLALPPFVGNTALFAWDECVECRGSSNKHLGPAFEAFARPLLSDSSQPPPGAIPIPAHKALVRMALSIMPLAELQYFGDALEWLANPYHARDAHLILGLGCLCYRTPAPIPTPFITLARRCFDSAQWPYMLVFLASGSLVLQTHIPLSSRDEHLEDLQARAPELSMSIGEGNALRASQCFFLEAQRCEDVSSHLQTASTG